MANRDPHMHICIGSLTTYLQLALVLASAALDRHLYVCSRPVLMGLGVQTKARASPCDARCS